MLYKIWKRRKLGILRGVFKWANNSPIHIKLVAERSDMVLYLYVSNNTQRYSCVKYSLFVYLIDISTCSTI